MKNLAVAAIAVSVCAFAADFWIAKPFTEWSEKDAQKMLENSPWSKTVSIAMGSGAPMMDNSRMGSSGRGSMGEIGQPGGGAASDDAMAGAGGGGGRGGRNRGGGDASERGSVQSATVVVRWATALPVRQAAMKLKYGSEAATSPESKKVLEAQENVYAVVISGVGRGMMGMGTSEALKKELLERTALLVKGKEDIKAVDVQMARGARGNDLVFVFPKKAEITLDDKEVEFATKFESLSLKQKFRLKDMMFDGKLSL